MYTHTDAFPTWDYTYFGMWPWLLDNLCQTSIPELLHYIYTLTRYILIITINDSGVNMIS